MPSSTFQTHEVTNQPPPFADVNLYLADAAFAEAVAREGSGALGDERDRLAHLGAEAGSARALEIGRLANAHPPRLSRFDAQGRPLNLVEFHPAYHDAMRMSFAAGLHCSAWDHLSTGEAPRPGAHVSRLAGIYMMTQMEAGHVCPITMTNAAVATLLQAPDLARPLLGKILSRTYDPSFAPIPSKAGITIGMGMTEKQGGTDVRANTTVATPQPGGSSGHRYMLVGHKWFMSAPMSDAFLMLAQAPRGLSCFLVPRFREDGTANALEFQRLKDKLGNRSNASSEVELRGAEGFLVGEEGRGIATIIEMVTLTRLDCAVASAGQMRLALSLALHHARHRRVFGRRLVEQPLMARVLADMSLDVEAATALSFRLARAFDRAAGDEREAAWRRLMTPVTKYWVCKMAPALGYEAMECLGGNGYVEEGLAARLYRELPLNAIWEGSGNVMCLDVLRVVRAGPEALDSVLAEIAEQSCGDPGIAALIASVRWQMQDCDMLETGARMLVETLALAAAAALLRANAPVPVADAFIATRLAGGFRHTYGAGRGDIAVGPLLQRASPEAG
ncbi:MAG: isovaleryl-CoA dehydrogenase [Hyphomicrobiaceae bacterium]|nr:isovaleryl-CoA dehydrogenase [Hyphomicrobiaceae bacterium]